MELRDRQRAEDLIVRFPLEKRFVDDVLELLLLLLVCPSLYKLQVEGVEIREFVELAFLSEWFGRRAVDTAVGEMLRFGVASTSVSFSTSPAGRPRGLLICLLCCFSSLTLRPPRAQKVQLQTVLLLVATPGGLMAE